MGKAWGMMVHSFSMPMQPISIGKNLTTSLKTPFGNSVSNHSEKGSHPMERFQGKAR